MHAGSPEPRFVGQVTDTLRTPTHRLLAGSGGRAIADLVFLDREQSGTAYRTCVRRARAVRTCFNTTAGRLGTPTVTPLWFPRGRYRVVWLVAGEPVARWVFQVV